MMSASKASEKWADIIPKIFEVVKHERSAALQELYALYVIQKVYFHTY